DVYKRQAEERPPVEVWGVFTRAEEEGLLGACILAEEGTLSKETAIVSLETSKELPCGRMGMGPIVRVGDRRSVFDPGISRALQETADALTKDANDAKGAKAAKAAKGFRYQRGLMDGGVCEATAFQAFGYAAGALALPLGNYHNMGAENRIAPEVVHRDDLWNLCRLLAPSAVKIAAASDGLAGLRESLRKKLPEAREELAATRAQDPPPLPRRTRSFRGSRTLTLPLALLAALALGSASPSFASPRFPSDATGDAARVEDPGRAKPAAGPSTRPRVAREGASDPTDEYDALRYDLSLRIDPEARSLSGAVRLRFLANTEMESVVLDFGPTLVADSAASGGAPCGLSRPDPERIEIALPSPVNPGAEGEVWLRYHGTPGDPYFANFEFFSSHGPEGNAFPTVASLSEPDRAHTFWPCKDRFDDKALVSVTVDLPDEFVVAGNGNRVRSEAGGEGRTLTSWETAYPIAPYLVSIAATDYAHWEEVFRAADGDSLPLLFYAFPEDSAKARVDFAATHEVLRLYETLFGPYPFRRAGRPGAATEKLGVAEFSWRSGAMEHQTCISYGYGFVTGDNRFDWTLAHEIAHQWWGDSVTPAALDDIWLNEGFAVYAEALLAESRGGDAGYRAWMHRRRLQVDIEYDGSVVEPDDPFGSTTYDKGAWVLHMLRGVLGRDAFFESLHEYYGQYAYGNASTPDFVRAVEETAGRDLRWFFDPWLYGTGRPILAWDWDASGDAGTKAVRLVVRQTQDPISYPHGAPDSSPPEIFAFPLEVRLFGAGDSLSRTIFVGRRSEVFSLASLPFSPDSIALDPDQWILREVLPRGTDLTLNRPSAYPNPSASAVDILFRALPGGPTRVEVFDVAGRRVREVETVTAAGPQIVRWDGEDSRGGAVASGVYFVRVSGPGGAREARVVIAR
ncbi:MAG: M1 family aminopeptidase, partial [Candidatus Eisenbacteria bacterium]|nr:M1 family aminopeptidase [Candidatus Eisenbacteria bacterium]